MATPTDIAKQSLDAIGSEVTIGDIEDGSREAEVLLRAYSQCLRQLLRSANWDFARKEAPLLMLADASGLSSIPNNPDAISGPVGSIVPGPFRFSYAYPVDCVRVRAVRGGPSSQGTSPDNISLPSTPVMQNLQAWPGSYGAGRGARFLISVDVNAPSTASPQGSMAILTDVSDAWALYTALMPAPDAWDPLFRSAFVSYLASEVALALTKDKRLGLQLRSQQIALTKAKIQDARVADGNEGTTTTNHEASWMRGRYGVGPSRMGLDSAWDSLSFADGTLV